MGKYVLTLKYTLCLFVSQPMISIVIVSSLFTYSLWEDCEKARTKVGLE